MSINLEAVKENFSAAFAKVRDALIWCGGGNSQIVHSLAPQSMDIFVGLGSIVVLVSVIGTVAATMAANLVFTHSPEHFLPDVLSNFAPWLAVLAGLVYGLLVFSVDRFLVATCPTWFEISQSGLGAFKLIFTVIMRVFVALLIAHLIALLLSLVLAQQELMQAAKIDWIKNSLAEQNKAEQVLIKQIKSAQIDIDHAKKSTATSIKTVAVPDLKDDKKYILQKDKKTELTKELEDAQLNFKKGKINKIEFNEKKRGIKKELKDVSAELSSLEKKYLKEVDDAQKKNKERAVSENSLLATKNKELEVLQGKYTEWVKNKADFLTLSKKFDDQLEQSFKKSEKDSGKVEKSSPPPIGVFTLVAQLEKEEGAATYEKPRQLIQNTLAAIELLALFLKVFSNRGDYARRYAEWEQDHIDQKEDSDRISEQNRAQKLVLDAEAELIQYEQEKKKETQKFINSCEEELEIHSHESQTFRRVCKEAIDHVARNWSNLSPNSESIPSAYGLHQNFKYASDRQASHNPLPIHDVVPSMESVKLNLVGSVKKSAIFGVLAAALAMAVYHNMNNGFSFYDQGTMLGYGAMAGIIVAAVTFIMTSPGVNTATRPAMWMAGALSLLMLSVYLASELAGLGGSGANDIKGAWKNLKEDHVLGFMAAPALMFLLYAYNHVAKSLGFSKKTTTSQN